MLAEKILFIDYSLWLPGTVGSAALVAHKTQSRASNIVAPVKVRCTTECTAQLAKQTQSTLSNNALHPLCPFPTTCGIFSWD